MRPRTIIIAGILLDVVGLMLFLSFFVAVGLELANDGNGRHSALGFVASAIGMGLMTIGSFMTVGGIMWAVVKNARKVANVVETANACRYCGAQRGGATACPACGAR
jgi:hypothetical protein